MGSSEAKPDQMVKVDYADYDRSKWGEELIQITFEEIRITTEGVKSGCCGRKVASKENQVKTVIDGISGTVLPGQFVAILGASGAGKTVLLNNLSGRDNAPGLHKEGSIRVNGRNKGDFPGSSYSQLSAYVQQDDVLFQTMTVRECFEFAAKLKLHGTAESK